MKLNPAFKVGLISIGIPNSRKCISKASVKNYTSIMGMFLSQYSMLKAIAYPDDQNISHSAEKILSRFKLFALVLHDPSGHPKFHQEFSQLFDRLDHFTGNDLLFMGIAKPAYNWYARNQDRDYFDIWDKQQLIHALGEIKSVDSSITCYSISSALEIEYDDLPCLVLAPSLKANNYLILRTSENFIEKQLTELGYFASSYNISGIFNDLTNSNNLIKGIDFLDDHRVVKRTSSLAAILSDCLSFTVAINSDDNRIATTHARKVVRQQQELAKQSSNNQKAAEHININILANLANRHLNDSDSNWIESLSDSSSQYSGLTKRPVEADNNPLRTLKSLCSQESFEPESKIISKTTELVFRLFKNNEIGKLFDYSPLVMGISKIFEIEVNLSAVHWIRKHLNIELPQYFKRCKPSFDTAKLKPDVDLLEEGQAPLEINFNRGRKSKWFAPGIGQSELIIKSLLNQQYLIDSFSLNEQQALLETWTSIRILRNKACHTRILKKADFEKAADLAADLISSGNLQRLLQLKRRYRGY